MPYDIAKDFEGCAYAVVKTVGGKRELVPGGCHPSAVAAGKHLAALEIATKNEYRAAGEWVIVDIDGTLTMRDGSDEPRQSLIDWMKGSSYSFAIVSARPDSRLAESRAWLESNDVPHSSVSLSNLPSGPNAGRAFKRGKAASLLKSHKVVMAIDNDEGARSAYSSLGIKAVGPTSVRQLDFDYELRHPGHGDQSVHSPHKHKGGGAAVASDLAAGREVTVAGRDLPDAFDAMANGDGGVNLNRLSTTDGVSFAATGVKVPRAEMPQVPGSKKAEFIAELDTKGVKSTRESVDPKSLKPIQSEISGQKSGQMLQSMREGKLLEGDNPLIVSRDGFVVDGHHRWAAAVARSYEVPVALPVLRIDMDAAQLLGEVKSFAEAQSIPARVFDRAVDFNYELRHPGHPDQSVHNPHKGGGAYAPGAWKPVSKEEIAASDRKVVADAMRKYAPPDWDGNPDTLTGHHEITFHALSAKYALERQAHGAVYQNGHVTVRMPGPPTQQALTKAQETQFLADVDKGLALTPGGMVGKDFPLDVAVVDMKNLGEWVGGREGGLIRIKRSVFDAEPLANTPKAFKISKGAIEPWHPVQVTNQRDIFATVAHEIGHATEDFGVKQFGVVRLARGVPYISAYARKNFSERYAEHFSAWALGDTSPATLYLAKKHEWRAP
jgi:hypothetical protein